MLKRRQRQIYPVGLWHKKYFFLSSLTYWLFNYLKYMRYFFYIKY